MEVFFMSDFKEINITELTASPYNLFNKDWALLTAGNYLKNLGADIIFRTPGPR